MNWEILQWLVLRRVRIALILVGVVLALLCWFILESTANANPFLACDPQAGVESYIISEDGQADITTPAQADGSIKHDLASVTEGTHLWNVRACNVWGCSEYVPFSFTKSLPGQLQDAKIIGE